MLKHLELNGFKSFAKRATLDFSSPITAVVGPNGSGKSNVTEAIQWVLGEQSLKSLRGKKGEDLIFAGSHSLARLGRASVKIVFDNSKKIFGDNFDFDSVEIERRVYRDGVNEYFLNGSKARLKDIVELLANVGLGSSSHHIISQGEADRVLYASPKERRGMIEDALGVKIYQLKRHEAERKLEKTEENMKQVESIRREIQPHLKFLERQAEKAAKAEEIRATLKEKLLEYLGKESSHIGAASDALAKEKRPHTENLLKKESEIARLKEELKTEENADKESEEIENKIREMASKIFASERDRSQMERDLGRIEGMIEASSRAPAKSANDISPEEVESFLNELERRIKVAMEESLVDKMRALLTETIEVVRGFSAKIFSSGLEKKDGIQNNSDEFLQKKEELEKIITNKLKEEEEMRMNQSELSRSLRESARVMRDTERNIYELESEMSRLKDELRALEIKEEKIRLRKEEFERDHEDAQRHLEENNFGAYDGVFEDAERGALKKEIERLKMRLEDAGGVDASVVKEFEETRARDEFFERELGDLGEAASNLKNLIKDLEEKLENDFKSGIAKINKEFQKFFETMFGGGRAELRMEKPRQSRQSADDENSETELLKEEMEEKEDGIEVFIDLPRKRIKSLEMLSGGERALTSIALLFALSAVNPPPFLVLDETDAALDEANSRRYGAMLDELSRNTQLIVVTHNRETMSHAGVLYGVTMGGDGISHLLSVKLEEAEKIAK